MQLRKATTFLASTAVFVLTSHVRSVVAVDTSLRGRGGVPLVNAAPSFDEDDEDDEILSEDKHGIFLKVSDITDCHCLIRCIMISPPPFTPLIITITGLNRLRG